MELLTQQEAATRLRVSVKTVQRLRQAGQLAYLPGPPVRIPADELERYVRRTITRDTPRPTPLVMRSFRQLSIKERARRAAAEVLASGHNPMSSFGPRKGPGKGR